MQNISKWFVILNLNEYAFIIILLYSNELCCFVAESVNQMKLFLLIYGEGVIQHLNIIYETNSPGEISTIRGMVDVVNV